MVGVETLLDGSHRQLQNLSPKGGLDRLEIDLVGRCAT
jgi:hypothetical protein